MRTTTPAATCSPISDCGESIDLAGELDAAVDRPGVHQQLARGRSRRESIWKCATYSRSDGHERVAHALELHPQRVDDVGLAHVRRASGATSQPSAASSSGTSVGGPATVTCAPSSVNAWMHERATRECSTSPTIQIRAPVDRAEARAQGVAVEQRLRRVLVLAVAGVDDRGVRPAREQARRAGVRRADHDRVGAVGRERRDGVAQRLALLDARAARDEVEDVGGEALRGELEASCGCASRPRRRG